MESRQQQQLQRKHSSRYLGPSVSVGSSPQQTISSDARRKPRPFEDRAPWTSSFKKAGTLADHITVNDSQLTNVFPSSTSRPGIGRFTQSADHPLSRHQQSSCSEFVSFDDTEDRDKVGRRSTKENRPQRFFGKLAFPRSTKLGEIDGGSTTAVLPGRLSMDVNALALSRQRSDHSIIITGELPTSESSATTTTTTTTTAQKAPITQAMSSSFNHKSPTSKVLMAESMMKRSNSYRSSTSQWALSPGRSPAISPPNSSQGNRPRSFSSLRPASPGKVRGGVGNFITSLGLDIFRIKKPPSSAVNRPSSPSSASSAPQRVTTALAAETSHQLRLVHNRLMQWHYLNAVSDNANETNRLHAEIALLNAWACVSKLRDSVVKKQLQIEQEKLGLKLNTILSSQMKALEGWGDIERQHTDVLSVTSDCLQSMVCRVPLIDVAKVESQSLSIELWQATDVATAINTTISTFTPKNQSTVPLLYELSKVATTEKSLLEECFELLDFAAALQLQEQSLKCHKIQLKSLRQQEISA